MAALSQYSSTSETTNTSRICRVVLDPCSDQLRDILRHYVPPSTFKIVIRQQRMLLPKLTKPQMDLILPTSGHYGGTYSDFDISLLYTLLRNICNIKPHMKGWGNDPDPSDKSLSANIERIRNVRNKAVGHLINSSLTHSDFNNLWSTIRTAVEELDTFLNNNQQYVKAVDFLKKERMDPEISKMYDRIIFNQMKEDKETRKMIQDHEANFEQFKVDNKARHDKTDDDIERLNAEILYIRQKIDEKLSTTDEEPDLTRLKQTLIEMYDITTRGIPLSAVQKNGDQLPMEHLFSSVVIREDIKENRKGGKSADLEEQQEGEKVDTPDDILNKHGKPVPRIFMLGKAAHGKTTYCQWLLKTWLDSQQQDVSERSLTKWESALKQFDFVFFIPFRNVDTSRANVTDMICNDILGNDTVLHKAAKYVLSDDKYRCFIMMDGLDEWKPDQAAIKQLKYRGMPNIDSMSNCVIFTTMRPWIFSEVEREPMEDRVIEIQGLDDKGIESVIEKVLVHYHKMNPNTSEYEKKYDEISRRLCNETMHSFIKIPLLAVICVQIWYEGEQVGDSMTSFYAAMVNMLIQRAHLKHDTQNLIFDVKNVSLPKLMSAKKNIKKYYKVLLKVGKVAYEGLVSKEMKLVFQKDDLETDIGERELQFALDVGLISQRDVHSAMEEKVSVQFFHKSVQEFLAAIYIVTNKEVNDSFCKHLCDIKVIMELSNVIMFMYGMRPSLGSAISQHIVSMTDRDTEICKYRESPYDKRMVEEMYKLQVSWYRELQYGQTDSLVTFHVSDVYLCVYSSDIETVRVTRELLSDHNVDIRSLYLLCVPTDGERGISDTLLNKFLGNTIQTRSLAMIFINCYKTERCVDIICGPTLTCLQLWYVTIMDSGTVHRPALSLCDQLQVLQLYNVTLGDRDLGLTPRMSMLQRVELWEIKMTESGWGRWLQSVIDIHRQYDVILKCTKIDRHTMSTIYSSSNLSVTHDKVYKNGDHRLEFTRVWPLTQESQ